MVDSFWLTLRLQVKEVFWTTLKKRIENRMEWFMSRGSVAKSMETKLLPKKLKTPKAKAKSDST